MSSVTAQTAGYYFDEEMGRGDVRWYELDIRSPTLVSVNVKSDHSNSMVISLYNPSGNFIKSEDCTYTGQCSLEERVSAPGVYKVMVTMGGIPYGMTVSKIKVSSYLYITRPRAYQIVNNQMEPGDAVWYDVQTVSPSMICIDTVSNYSNSMTLSLYDPSGVEIIKNSSSYQGHLALTYTTLGTGLYRYKFTLGNIPYGKTTSSVNITSTVMPLVGSATADKPNVIQGIVPATASPTTPMPTPHPANNTSIMAGGVPASKVAAPVAAVTVGTGLSIVGLLLGKIGLNSSFLSKLSNFFFGFQSEHLSQEMGAKARILRKVRNSSLTARTRSISLETLVAVISALLLGLAFVLSKNELSINKIIIYTIVAGVVTVIHELAHKVTATYFKRYTEYRFWGLGIVSMFTTSILFGTVFAQPSRTIIYQDVKPATAADGGQEQVAVAVTDNDDKIELRKNGVTALSGPVVSLLCSLAFLAFVPVGAALKLYTSGTLPADQVTLGDTLTLIGFLGFSMNLLSTVYNLVPIEPMDGHEVYAWNKLVWIIAFVPAFILYLVVMIQFL